jgi:molybdopterin converting factor small subunit
MNVHVKLFAVAKQLARRDELPIELPPGATIADLRQRVAAECPALGNVLPHALWAVDAEYADETTPLNEQSNIALIPPVSGG